MSISRRPVNDGTGAGFPSPAAATKTPAETEDVTPVEDVTPTVTPSEEKVEDVVILDDLDETENVEAEPVLDDADEAEAAPAPKSRKRAAKNTPTED